jgi:hypothetical protein
LTPAVILVALALSALPARAEPLPGPFELREQRVPGRAVDAFVARGEDGREAVFVISLQESAPEERRSVTKLASDGGQPARSFEVPRAVVAIDAIELGLAPGPELLWLSAGELRIVSQRGETLRRERLDPPLPLPARSWELERLELVRDWDSDGRPEVLLPTSAGARLHPLVPGDVGQSLALPLIADYGSPTLDNPFRPGLLAGVISWPMLELADDDGDGRPDLFAATRFELLVFRAGADGLGPEPTRRLRFPPFSPEEERRHLASTLLAFPRDLDGDGRADLVVHRMVGELTRSRSTTTVHANGGAGPDPQADPWTRLDLTGGTAAVELEDIDGDGRVELLEAHIGFGVLQAIRILTLRRVEARLRVLSLPAVAGAAPLESWADDVSFPFDFGTMRIKGLLPYTKADWNGDGRRDLLWGDGSGKLRFRLGGSARGGPAFGPVVATVPLALSGDLVSADLDGDGLTDFVAYDPLDLEGRVRIGRNLGTLPGTPPALRALPD